MPKGLPYFYVDEPGERVRLSDEDLKHATRSLRLRAGSEVTVSDGRGWVGRGPMSADGEIEVAESRTLAPPPPPRIRVTVAPPAGERAWWAVQKLTELGVDEIALTESARSTRRMDEGVARRGGALLYEAAKQSRRAFVPGFTVGRGRDLFAGAPDREAAVVLYEGEAPLLRACLLDEPGPTLGLYIGPEGGLAPEELEAARERGAVLASLGEPNLRTETAAIAAAAIVLSRYGRLG
jgi:16S rRNA (uracil1498-N3)-methyltransferase